MLISLCGERTCETYKTIDAQYLAGTNQLRVFKFARVIRSRYLVSLCICYVLFNVRDKNPLYGILMMETILFDEVDTSTICTTEKVEAGRHFLLWYFGCLLL